MRASAVAAFLVALLFAVGPGNAEGETLLDRANAWKPSELLPAELLHTEEKQCCLHTITQQRHVTVGCLYTKDTDVPSAERDATLAKITAELRVGKDFAAVLKKYSDAHGHDETSTLADGTKDVRHLTRVGNNGDFVLTATNRRAIAVPAAHARPLLTAKQGDGLILRNAARHRLDLYCVREVYDLPAS